MSGFVTRWPVLLRESVAPADLDTAEVDGAGVAGRGGGGGEISAAAVGRWRARACTAYLQRCALLQRLRRDSLLDWAFADVVVPAGVGLGHPDAVAVSARATEINRSSFTIAVRVRALDSGSRALDSGSRALDSGSRALDSADAVLDLAARVALIDPRTGTTEALGADIRDELIAIEHAAAHLN